MLDAAAEKTLIDEIVHCPHARQCREDSTAENPCRTIVDSQNTINEFQVPEPWSGQIAKAPLLFLSSNPSIGMGGVYPTWNWSSSDVEEYFTYRFRGGRQQWIIDGTKSLLQDGTYSHAIRFWAAVRKRAIELFQRDVTPGVDYALTEIVHCKSRKEIGVKEAQQQCVNMYLRWVLEFAGAVAIVVLGVRAKQAIQSQFKIEHKTSISESIEIGGRERLFAFLPHPNAHKVRSFEKCFSKDELDRLGALLQK